MKAGVANLALARDEVRGYVMNILRPNLKHGIARLFPSEIDARVSEDCMGECLRWIQSFIRRWSGTRNPGVQYHHSVQSLTSPGLALDRCVLCALPPTLVATSPFS